jgi:hypothetical protein
VRGPLKTPLIAIIAAVVGSLLPFAALYVYVKDFSFRAQPFAAEVWRAGDASVRGTMVHDLMRQELLRGRTAADVVDFLGPPEWSRGAYERGSRYYITYKVYVGKKLGTRPWPHFLHLVLSSPDGLVEDVYLAD